jgi:excisionase family DNA binding protein
MTNVDELLQKITKIENDFSEMKMASKEVLNLSEACRYLDLSESSMYKMTHKGLIPSYKPNGKRLYFKRSELDSWLLRIPQKKLDHNEINKAAADYLIKNKSKSLSYDFSKC